MIKKISSKGQGHFSIDNDVLEKFKKLSKKMSINKSSLIENFMKDWIEKNNNNKDN
jgi:metal-responsive CopG/Arc/MetJ family transcriptional regulator